MYNAAVQLGLISRLRGVCSKGSGNSCGDVLCQGRLSLTMGISAARYSEGRITGKNEI